MEMNASLRERKKEETRVALIRAAVELFSTRGYEATTVEDIAAAANYSRATFFRYFSTKDDVVFGDILDRLDSAHAAFAASLPTDDPWTIARTVVAQEVVTFTAPGADLEAACFALWLTEPALQQRFAATMTQWEQQVAAFFGAAWSVEPTTDLDCILAGMVVVAVARSAMSLERRAGGEVAAHLRHGFDALEGTFAAGLSNRGTTPRRRTGRRPSPRI